MALQNSAASFVHTYSDENLGHYRILIISEDLAVKCYCTKW